MGQQQVVPGCEHTAQRQHIDEYADSFAKLDDGGYLGPSDNDWSEDVWGYPRVFTMGKLLHSDVFIYYQVRSMGLHHKDRDDDDICYNPGLGGMDDCSQENYDFEDASK